MSTRRHSQSFWHCRVPLVKFSYWSKFHVNTIMKFFKNLCQYHYEKLWKFLFAPVWEFCQVSGDWGDLGIPSLAWMLLIVGKCQVYSFCRFWVTKGKLTTEGSIKIPPSPRLGLKNIKKIKKWNDKNLYGYIQYIHNPVSSKLNYRNWRNVVLLFTHSLTFTKKLIVHSTLCNWDVCLA